MKKIFLGVALSFATLAFAQQYPNNGYGNSGYGYDNGYDNGYYDDYDDQNYFPDDYYYNYPQDYYPQDYYQSYYNDYRNSIVNINWNSFFGQVRLAPWQVREILRLNDLYNSFASWNNFYRYNPDRWYYDRFYALERIMGPRVFVIFQNNYYQGHRPIVYFQNYRRSFYSAPRFAVVPRYRNININIYKVNRSNFLQKNPTIVIANRAKRNYDGRADNRNMGEGFRTPNTSNRDFRSNGNNAVRPNNDAPRSSNGGFRGNNESPRSQAQTPRSVEGPRNNRDNGGFRSNGGSRNAAPNIQNNGSRPSRENNNSQGQRSNSGFRSRLANS